MTRTPAIAAIAALLTGSAFLAGCQVRGPDYYTFDKMVAEMGRAPDSVDKLKDGGNVSYYKAYHGDDLMELIVSFAPSGRCASARDSVILTGPHGTSEVKRPAAGPDGKLPPGTPATLVAIYGSDTFQQFDRVVAACR